MLRDVIDYSASLVYWVALLAAWNGDVGIALCAQVVSLNLSFATE